MTKDTRKTDHLFADLQAWERAMDQHDIDTGARYVIDNERRAGERQERENWRAHMARKKYVPRDPK